MDWQRVTEQIKQEVSLTRELLSNLVAEENSLRNANQLVWNEVMHKRFDLTQSLKPFRTHRALATKQFKDLTFTPSEDVASEIAWLLDQLLPLIEKVNEQNSKNQELLQKNIPLIANRVHLPYSEIQTPQRKNKVITLPREEKN